MKVRELLACEPLLAGTLVGGEAGLDAGVVGVGVCAVASSVESAAAGSLLVLSQPAFSHVGSLDLELALRKARAREVACLVAAAPQGAVPASTVRLADKLELPLVSVAFDDAGTLAHRLSELVHQPQLAQAHAVTGTVATIWAVGSTVDGILDAVARSLGGRCSVVGTDGSLVAGENLGVPLGDHLSGGALRQLELAGARYSMLPVPLEQPLANALWLVAEQRRAGADRELTKPVLEVAVWALAARFANDRLIRERDARSRSVLLAELQDATVEPIGKQVVARAVLAGWRLDGWHAAVQLATIDPQPSERFVALAEDLELVLRRHGMTVVVVPNLDGWAFWRTADGEPAPAAQRELIAALTLALRTMMAEHPSLDLCAGVGRAHAGPLGIGRSLAEARQAGLLARAAKRSGAVEHIDELGIKPLLVGLCSEPAFQELARALLAPALEAEGGEELFRTLDCYLDHESSVKSAAALLDVHRNTVAARLERLRALLALDLQQPDERLVLQLACRALRLQKADRWTA